MDNDDGYGYADMEDVEENVEGDLDDDEPYDDAGDAQDEAEDIEGSDSLIRRKWSPAQEQIGS
eukprot:gene10414-19115_t